jgi:hypothetical protein
MVFEATLDTSNELVLFVSLDVTFLNTFREIILNTDFTTSPYLSNRHTIDNPKYILSKEIYSWYVLHFHPRSLLSIVVDVQIFL